MIFVYLLPYLCGHPLHCALVLLSDLQRAAPGRNMETALEHYYTNKLALDRLGCNLVVYSSTDQIMGKKSFGGSRMTYRLVIPT